MQVLLIDVRERAQAQIPLVGIITVKTEARLFLARLHSRRIFESVTQAKGAVVMEIVPDVHVGGRGLR